MTALATNVGGLPSIQYIFAGQVDQKSSLIQTESDSLWRMINRFVGDSGMRIEPIFMGVLLGMILDTIYRGRAKR